MRKSAGCGMEASQQRDFRSVKSTQEQVANGKDDRFLATPAAVGGVNHDGGLLSRVTGGEGAIFHRPQVEPGFASGAEIELRHKRSPAHLAVMGVSEPIAAVVGGDLAD